MMKKKSYTIYIADIRPLLKEKTGQKVYRRLPESRQKKADSCKTPTAKAASLAAGFLMEYALKKQGNAEYRIEYEEGGAPIVLASKKADETDDRRFFISVSHSGDYAACVISDRPVGIDIQQIRPVRTNTLHHFFSEAGIKAFVSDYEISQETAFLNEKARNAFLWQWAAKESYMKLTGEGMRLGFERLLIDRIGKNICIRDQMNRYAPARIYEHHVLEDYCLTVCVGEKQ